MARLTCLFAILLFAIAPLQAKHKPDKPHGNPHAAAASVFPPAGRAAIVNYYRSNPGGLPPGLAKRGGNLPPGLEKQLRRNGTLPPGLAKRVAPFPPQLEAQLPPCPSGVRRGFVGGVAVMWNSRSGLILDAVAVIGQ